MLQVKRWAKQYLFLSPIFHSKAFNLPNNQHIMKINPRLLAPYCLKMLKKSLYDRQKVTQILEKYNTDSKCYWSNYVYYILQPNELLLNFDMSSPMQDNRQSQKMTLITQKIAKFRLLLSKSFHRTISRNQFSQLGALYLILLQAEAITQMDNFVIDLSLFEVWQLLLFSEMKFQSSLNAIGYQSLSILQKFVNNSKTGNYFSIISNLNRLYSKLDKYPELQILSKWLSPQANHQQILQGNPSLKTFLAQQSIVFMVWLFHIHELGQFLYVHVKKNYLLNEYIQQSLKIICKIMSILQIDQQLSKTHLLLLVQVVSKTLQIQAQTEIFEQFQKNIQFQIFLKKMKNRLSKILEKGSSDKLKWQPENIQISLKLIQQINSYQINYQSFISKNFIKSHIQQLISHPYASLIIPPNKAHCLLQVCYKMDNSDLSKKIVQKLKIKLQSINVLDLVGYLNSVDAKVEKPKNGLFIGNVCQLKRVKQWLTRHKILHLHSHHKFTLDQLKSLKILLLTLNNPNEAFKNNKEIQDLKSFFTSFEL